jgi:hypothetical protein
MGTIGGGWPFNSRSRSICFLRLAGTSGSCLMTPRNRSPISRIIVRPVFSSISTRFRITEPPFQRKPPTFRDSVPSVSRERGRDRRLWLSARGTLACMNVALDRVCEHTPLGEQHEVRERVAEGIIRCAKSGRTALGALIEAGKRSASLSRIDHMVMRTPRTATVCGFL